jgi:hypothetical protein
MSAFGRWCETGVHPIRGTTAFGLRIMGLGAQQLGRGSEEDLACFSVRGDNDGIVISVLFERKPLRGYKRILKLQ